MNKLNEISLMKLKESRPALRPNSYNAYKRNIQKVFKECKLGTDINDFKWLLKTEIINKCIRETENPETARSLITSLIVFYHMYYPDNENIYELRKLRMEFLFIKNKLLEEQKASEKRITNHMTLTELTELYDTLYTRYNNLFNKNNLTRKEKYNLTDLLLMGLFVLQPPRRPSAFSHVILITEEEYNDTYINNLKKNYLVFNNTDKSFYFIYNVFKTVKKIGQQKINVVNPVLQNLLFLFYKKFKTGSDVPLLSNNDGHLMSANNISIRFKKIFKQETGKLVSPSHLRSIYVSEYYSQNISRKKKRLMAWQMAHSVDVADEYYNKVNLNE